MTSDDNGPIPDRQLIAAAFHQWVQGQIKTTDLIRRIDEVENPFGKLGEIPPGLSEGDPVWFLMPGYTPEPGIIIESTDPDSGHDRWFEVMATENGSVQAGDELSHEDFEGAQFAKRWKRETP